MTHKYNITSQVRGFYYAASGDDVWDGLSFETPKQTIQAALDATQNLVPPPDVSNFAQVKEAQGGVFTEAGITLYDGVSFEGSLTTIVTSDPLGIKAANGMSLTLQATINSVAASNCIDVDDVILFSAYLNSVTVGGVNGIGFNIQGVCERVFLDVSQLSLDADGAIGYRCSAILPTPLDINDNTIVSPFQDVIYIRHNSPSVADVVSIDVTTICLTGANTIAFDHLGGRLDVAANIVKAEKLCVVNVGAQFSLDAQICEGDVLVSGTAILKSIGILMGDIVVSGGGVLEIICLNHIGNITVAPGGVINGIINGIPYGNWIPKIISIESLAPAITNTPYDPVTGVLKVDQDFEIEADGEYILEISFSGSSASTFRSLIVGIFIDDVLLTDEYDKESKDAGDLTWPSKTVRIPFTVGTHNLKVRFGRASGFGGVFVTLQDFRFYVSAVRSV